MLYSAAAVCTGACLGALLRWLIALLLNPLLNFISIGTLAANLLGCYLAGVAIGLFLAYPGLNDRWGLLIITGFLGSLTTFSAFSIEMVTLLQQGLMMRSGGLIFLHVGGSVAMTFAGMATFTFCSKYF